MRLSELAETSGTPIPTIKYYIREGLLPPGRVTSPRQADYAQSHVDRLRLVRALVDVGGLSLAAVRDVLTAMAGPSATDSAVSLAHGTLSPRPATGTGVERARAVMALLGWQVDESSTAMAQLESALTAIDEVGLDIGPERMRVYGEAVMSAADYEIDAIEDDRAEDPVGVVTYVVLGTVLYEPLLLALRRLAQSDAYRRRMEPPSEPPSP